MTEPLWAVREIATGEIHVMAESDPRIRGSRWPKWKTGFKTITEVRRVRRLPDGRVLYRSKVDPLAYYTA